MRNSNKIWIGTLAACLLLSLLAFAPGGNSWIPSFTTQLGIEIVGGSWDGDFSEAEVAAMVKDPPVDVSFLELKAVVLEPARLALLGFPGVKEGAKVAITPGEAMEWTVVVKEKTVHPCSINITVQDFFNPVTLVPEKDTLKLSIKK